MSGRILNETPRGVGARILNRVEVFVKPSRSLLFFKRVLPLDVPFALILAPNRNAAMQPGNFLFNVAADAQRISTRVER